MSDDQLIKIGTHRGQPVYQAILDQQLLSWLNLLLVQPDVKQVTLVPGICFGSLSLWVLSGRKRLVREEHRLNWLAPSLVLKWIYARNVDTDVMRYRYRLTFFPSGLVRLSKQDYYKDAGAWRVGARIWLRWRPALARQKE